MIRTSILAGLFPNTGLLWELDGEAELLLPIAFFAAIIFIAINLAYQKPTSAPPKC